MLCPKCLPTFTEDSGSCLVPPIVDAYLKTNNAPLDLEIVDIRDSLQNLQQSLIQVDEEIKLLSQTLEKLKTRRVDISKAISKHSGVLSPVRRLPPEMLGEIFIRANDGCYAVFRHVLRTLGPKSCQSSVAGCCLSRSWMSLG